MYKIDLFLKAFKFASFVHNGQLIPGSELPYIVHIASVCFELSSILDEATDNDLIMTCAALHDSIEDTNTSYEEIKKAFGLQVAEGVQALTKNYTLPKEIRITDSIERIILQPKEIWMVKLADRISNLNQPPSTWDKKKIENYYYQSCELYEKLHDCSVELSSRFLIKLKEYKEYFS
ncbi:HD domain-containing protein [Mucilaginibacter sp.]|uniref:HD domain-containing protein n=1 Tax=Mucilaginibacter sp. TaxID=1882438 RepID=UPI002634BE28|nr:HD domain-containing protein [Mucilaginibacter sp.]MDB4921218.1 hypothetical protein [Mucilaginibacter sp.]